MLTSTLDRLYFKLTCLRINADRLDMAQGLNYANTVAIHTKN